MMPYSRLFLMALLCFGCVEDSETPGSHSNDMSTQADQGSDGSLGADVAASSVDAERPGPDARVEPVEDAEPAPTDAIQPPHDAGVLTDASASESDAAEPRADAAVDMNRGHIATGCGAEEQGIMPVDCTAEGDQNAQCVFSNHCMCSKGSAASSRRCGLEHKSVIPVRSAFPTTRSRLEATLEVVVRSSRARRLSIARRVAMKMLSVFSGTTVPVLKAMSVKSAANRGNVNPVRGAELPIHPDIQLVVAFIPDDQSSRVIANTCASRGSSSLAKPCRRHPSKRKPAFS